MKRPCLMNMYVENKAKQSLLILAILSILNLTNDAHAATDSSLQTAKHWKLISYNFQPQAAVNDANFYNPMNVLITGLAVARDRIFIATPKLFSGVPSTLSYVSKSKFGDSPVLQAYPDWSFSTTGRKDFNCSDLVLISSYRIRIDSCNRLWVLDAGISRSLEDYEKTCPPKILVIDLNTDQVVRRIDFPSQILRGESLFTNLVIDETTSKRGTCDDVFVYISDTVEPAIIVYDSERDVTWRLTHPAMYPDPDFAQSEILGHRFILMDGVVGLTYDPKAAIVYFQPLATDRVFSITREALRAGPLPTTQLLPVKLVGKKSSQGIGLAVSPIDGSLLFSPMSETAIASWNPTTNQQSVLAYDRDSLQFIADITTTQAEDGVVYAIASRFHRFFLKNVNPNEYNNRIVRLELPGAGLISGGIQHVNQHLNAYSLFPSAPASAPALTQFSSFYHTSPLAKNIISPPTTNIFTSSAVVANQQQQYQHRLQQQHPYSFETTGIINYSLRNPFNALNQGESFPPSKENRDVNQKSFLDTLVDTRSVTPSPYMHSIYPSLGQNTGYHYRRGLRSIKPEDNKAPEK